jgi:hypothetical protein
MLSTLPLQAKGSAALILSLSPNERRSCLDTCVLRWDTIHCCLTVLFRANSRLRPSLLALNSPPSGPIASPPSLSDACVSFTMADEKQDPGSLGSGASPLSQPAHSLTPDAVLSELQSKLEDGLTNEEAKARLQQYGPNKLDEGEGVSMIKILVGQVANAMMLVKGPISLLFSPPIL